MEHENREPNVVGGIVDIAQKEQSLDKYFLIAPELLKIQQKFEEVYGNSCKNKRMEHHKMTGGKLSRLGKNALKVCHVFQEHGDPFYFAGEHELINMLAQSVMGETVTVTNGIL